MRTSGIIAVCACVTAFGQTMSVHTQSGTSSFEMASVDSITFVLGYGTVEQMGDFCLADNDIPGWIVWEQPCSGRGALELYDLINGGAGEYVVDHGMLEFTYQELTCDSLSMNAYAMDFGNNENADSIFNVKQALATTRVPIDGYDESTAVLGSVAGGYVLELFARMGRYFFWARVLLAGSLDDQGRAADALKQLLDLHKSKLQ
jgi:hypothetical protein